MSLCNEVQELVSAAYDGEVTDAEAIAAAKAHCANCAECGAFVTFLGAVRRLESPPAPEETVARVLDAVRVEMAADAAAREAAAADDAAASQESEAAPDGTADIPTAPADVPASPGIGDSDDGAARPASPGTPVRPDWLAWRPWIAAAAVLFVGAVLIGAQGVRYIMSPTPTAVPLGESSFESLTADDPALRTEPVEEDALVDDGTADLASPAEAQPEATDYIAFNGSVYRLTGDATAPETPSTATVVSALDSGSVPQQREAWPGPSPRTLVVAAGPERHLSFERVERTLSGRTFALAAERVDSFASTVGLPSGIPRPTSPDGSPTFVSGGTDDAGTEVFVRPGADPLAGFALAPGEVSADWTWWLPVQ